MARMSRRRFIGFCITFVLVAALLYTLPFLKPRSQGGNATALVERVIDGDTLVLAGGTRVRLLGIDTPERGQALYAEAKEQLAQLAEGKNVTLEKDTTDTDKYGRLLRHVFAGGTHLPLLLVREGLAAQLQIDPNRKYAGAIAEAEAEARAGRTGIWEHEPRTFCVYVQEFRSNAAGDDRENLNGEFFVLKNKCAEPVSLAGWTAADHQNHTFSFPPAVILPKSQLSIRSGKGSANATNLFWGSETPVWNNNGDTLTLRDASGAVVLSYAY